MAASWRASRAFIRQFSSAASPGKPAQDPGATANMWKKIFYFVAVPAICLSQLNCYLLTKEEEANFERPEFIPYEYLRVITKPFPWADGKRSLFHNPHVNPLPTGYED